MNQLVFLQNMLEVDTMSYIFGSFARHKHNTDSTKKKTLSKISHDRSKSTPHTSKKTTLLHSRAKSVCSYIIDDISFKCAICLNLFNEPKVLPCLHSFCLKCLQELAEETYQTLSNDSIIANDSRKISNSLNEDRVKSSTIHDSCSSPNLKEICCPTCGARAEVPHGGVAFYPPNYVLQHRMVLYTLNSPTTHLLCDECTSDVSATVRCMDCAMSFCEKCKKMHLKLSEGHEVLSLEEARKRGITKIRRQIMCMMHPDLELEIFCSTCCQVLCNYCISTSHKGHSYEPVSKAIRTYITDLRLNAERAKSIAEQSALAANRLLTSSKTIETQCEKVQLEIEQFINNYIKSVENHKRNLLEQVNSFKNEKLEEIQKRRFDLHNKVKEARDVSCFLDELLNEGSDVEVMSFLKPVMIKMNKCKTAAETYNDIINVDTSLLFLPEEIVQNANSFCPLYGIVTTQTVSPEHCHLITELGFNNLRIGKRTEMILETRDKNGIKLGRGGDHIIADIRYKNSNNSKCFLADVDDNRNGTYTISFIPDIAGKLLLNVYINGYPIKDSPFSIFVRSLKPHYGTFHCCCFCSSGGNKEAKCGCGGKMPGGYKGCGHGHERHPGRRHWSCCGNIIENSECIKSNNHYQFTL